MPLVKEDRYKINLDLWREKQNSTNSESSSVEYINQNREDEHVKDTQELFEEYCRQRRKQHLQFQQEEEKRLQQREQEMFKSLQAENEVIYNVDDEVALINETPRAQAIEKNSTAQATVARDNSDEPVLMSPLMVESDSDADDVPEISHDPREDIEIVDLSSEEREEEEEVQVQEQEQEKEKEPEPEPELVQESEPAQKQQKQQQKSKEQNKVDELNNKTKQVDDNAKKTKQIEDNDKKADNSKRVYKTKSTKKHTELDRLKENIVDKLKITGTPSKRLTRHAKEEEGSTKRLKDRLEEKRVEAALSKRPKSNDRAKTIIKQEKPSDSQTPQKTIKQNDTPKTTKETPKTNTKAVEKDTSKTPKNSKNTKDNEKSNTKNSTTKENKQTNDKTNTTTPLTSRKTRNVEKSPQKTPTKQQNNQITIKQEIVEETPQPKRTNVKDSQTKQVNSEKIHFKRELEITPVGVHNKETRSMQRLTRSAGVSCKYIRKNLALQIDKINKPKKKPTATQKENNKTKKSLDDRTKEVTDKISTQMSIISHRSSQDYESIQCAQRLSGAVASDNGPEKSGEFLVPPTPNNNVGNRNSLLPSSLNSSAGFFTETDVIFIPPSNSMTASTSNTNRKRDQVILLSSSDNENSTSQSSSTNVSATSRRTRALKPKRAQQQQQNSNTEETSSKVPSFSELLAQQNTRASAKSPDLFSNCSDLLPCTQPNLESEEPNTPFEGFKIFGSEVKQLQQHYAFAKNNTPRLTPSGRKSYREQRSCLDILEKMFEPSNKKQKSVNNEKTSSSTTPTKKSPRTNNNNTNKQKPHAPILPSHPIEAIAEAKQQEQERQNKRKRCLTSSSTGLNEDEIFEITNNGTFGSVMRLHSNGEISPVQQTQKSNQKQHNKITNYLIGNSHQNGSSGSQEEATPNSGNSTTEAGTPSKRHQQLAAVQNSNVKKSPKGKCSSTQTTKLTKWFIKPSELAAVKAKSSSSKKTSSPTKQQQQKQQQEVRVSEIEIDLTNSEQTISPTPTTGKRILKRRRLDLSFNK